MNLNKDNIEEQILLFVDAEFDEASERDLMSYIDKHPEYQSMLDHYLMAKLDAVEQIIFPDKQSLIREESNIVALKRKPTFQRIAAAAALVIILAGSSYWFSQNKENSEPIIANNKGKEEISDKKQPKQQPGTSHTLVRNEKVKILQQTKRNMPNTTLKKLKQQEEVVVYKRNKIEHIASQQLKLFETKIAINAIPNDNFHVVTIAKEEKAGLPQWLPVNEGNLQGINEIAARVQNIKEAILEKKAQLKNRTLVVNLAGKEFTIGNKQ